MKKNFVFLVFFFLSILFCHAWPQLTQEQVAEREKWEEFLKTSEIVGYEQPLDPREAVTEPWKLTLKKDGVTMYAWWKNVEGRPKGYPDSWKWEIAAYHLDKYLGIRLEGAGSQSLFRRSTGVFEQSDLSPACFRQFDRQCRPQ